MNSLFHQFYLKKCLLTLLEKNIFKSNSKDTTSHVLHKILDSLFKLNLLAQFLDSICELNTYAQNVAQFVRILDTQGHTQNRLKVD